LLSGALSTVVMLAAYALSSGNANKYFSAVLGLAISTTMVSYLFIFPTVIRLRKTHPDTPRPYRIPGGIIGVRICGKLATLWALLATIGLIWPGIGVNWFGGTGVPDASLPSGFENKRWEYEMTQVIPLLLVLAIGAIFYALGAPTRKRAELASKRDREAV
jgi:amino acid transporter